MPLRRVGGRVVAVCVVRMDAAARPRLAVRGQEVRARPGRAAPGSRASPARPASGEPLAGRARAAGSADDRTGPSARNRDQAAGHRAQRVLQRRRRAPADDVGGRDPPGPRARNRSSASHATSRRSSSDASPSRVRRDAELREHERDVRLVLRQAGEDPQRLIERLFDQPRHFGLVRHLEAGIEIRLERELAQQRQAERVDRADRDLAEPIADLVPARPVELRPRRRCLAARGRCARASRPPPCA